MPYPDSKPRRNSTPSDRFSHPGSPSEVWPPVSGRSVIHPMAATLQWQRMVDDVSKKGKQKLVSDWVLAVKGEEEGEKEGGGGWGREKGVKSIS